MCLYTKLVLTAAKIPMTVLTARTVVTKLQHMNLVRTAAKIPMTVSTAGTVVMEIFHQIRATNTVLTAVSGGTGFIAAIATTRLMRSRPKNRLRKKKNTTNKVRIYIYESDIKIQRFLP